MQSCTFPINHSIRTSFNLKTSTVPEQWATVFVQLEDIGRVAKKLKSEDTNGKKRERRIKEKSEKRKNVPATVHSSSPTLLCVPVSDESDKSIDLKETSWNPDEEYEIEKILGHKNYKNRVLYLIKWKNWPDEYNTYEPIENLTNCNYLLMKYLEKTEPNPNEIKRMNAWIEGELSNHELYSRLTKFGYRREDLNEFSKTCVDISDIFQEDFDLHLFKKNVKEEYSYIVRCLLAMNKQDIMLTARCINYRIALNLVQLRCKQLCNLSEAESVINSLEETEVQICNNEDLMTFPYFDYVTKMEHGVDITIPMDPLLGCQCLTNCSHRSKCCPAMAGSAFAYNSSKILQIAEGYPIYECNQKCSCSKNCPNRVVQNGRKQKLCIFKTKSCGWGVRAVETIKRGTFVAEYIGELITEKEASIRDMENSSHGKLMTSYLFDLDFNPDLGSEMYSIDASKIGNLARFINHSCDPNLAVYPVWIDCLDPNLPRLAFFAKKTIKKNEEITFDYENIREDLNPVMMSNDDGKNPSIRLGGLRCECKAANCRGWLFRTS